MESTGRVQATATIQPSFHLWPITKAIKRDDSLDSRFISLKKTDADRNRPSARTTEKHRTTPYQSCSSNKRPRSTFSGNIAGTAARASADPCDPDGGHRKTRSHSPRDEAVSENSLGHPCCDHHTVCVDLRPTALAILKSSDSCQRHDHFDTGAGTPIPFAMIACVKRRRFCRHDTNSAQVESIWPRGRIGRRIPRRNLPGPMIEKRPAKRRQQRSLILVTDAPIPSRQRAVAVVH